MQVQTGRVFPLYHFAHYGNFRHYYPFGNSPAEDFLQSLAASECRHPTVLSLGCGDVRSCMYTIWKNFGFEGKNSSGFKGVNFVLNDRSTAVLARNILFLYLCMRVPDESDSRKDWISSMWSLWYNHELQPQHDAMLSRALAQLIHWAHTWQEWSECRLGGVVRFSSPATFAAIKEVWGNWLSHSMEPGSIDEMKLQRNSFQCHHLSALGEKKTRDEVLEEIATRDVTVLMVKATRTVYSEKISTMVKEYLSYLKEGTVRAESVLDTISTTSTTVLNPTLFERADGMYSLQYALTPYMGFIQNFQYTRAEVHRTLGKEISPQLLPVADRHFERVPLLANSVQQFSMWLEATAHVIRKSSGSKVSFTFDLDDAINLCYHLLHQPEKYSESGVKVVPFDAIYTSNLLDHLSPPALVLSALPLLKSAGTLFTATFRYTLTASSSSEYLGRMFGFSPELFPALLGIRCLGHDGKYSSTVNTEPSPDFAFPYHKALLWRNIKSQCLAINNLEESPRTTHFLLELCKFCCFSSTLPVGSHSIESFVIVLHQFLGRLQPTLSSSHHFLKPLSSAIQKEVVLKPHLIQLQTQSLLHGVHMHITFTDDNCPLCKGQPLESYIQQFTVCFDIRSKADRYETPTFTIFLISSSGDHALVTSVAGRSSGSTLTLDFFLLKQCLSQYSEFKVNMTTDEQDKCIVSGIVNDLENSTTEYLFLKVYIQPCTTEEPKDECPMGNIVKHIGDHCIFETIVSINKVCQTALKISKLNANCIASNQLKLSCGTLTATIVYPYAIDESKVHVQISKKRSVITITVTRDVNVFYKEETTFYIDPSNKLALPRFQCHIDAMETYCNLQVPLNPPDHPLFNAKFTFKELFNHATRGEKYFTLAFESKRVIGSPDVYALVYVHDVRFNTAFSSPVLDVSYCFLDTKPKHLINFATMCNELGNVRSIIVDEAEYKLLKEIFNYFSTITCSALSTEKHTVTLPVERNRLWKHFDHAILFLLYPNPENPKFQKFAQFAWSAPLQSRFLTPKDMTYEHLAQRGLGSMNVCSFCRQFSAILKKCARCQKAKYCGKECQRMHWKLHIKLVCKTSDPNPQEGTSTENKPSSLPQTHMGVQSSNFDVLQDTSQAAQHKQSKHVPQHTGAILNTVCMRCKKPAHIDCSCKSVSYCSKECQTLDWPGHSKKCNRPTDDPSSSDLHKTSSMAASSKIQGHSDDSEREPTSLATSKCAHCSKTKSSLKRCGKCRSISYCSVECQRLHWPQHKHACSAVRK